MEVHLEQEEHLAYSRLMMGLSVSGNISPFLEDSQLLPKNSQLGKVAWLSQGCGCIHTLDPVFQMDEFFFHLHDCAMEDGVPATLSVGDRVMFTIVIRDDRVCAVGVRRIARRTESSPDFSRLIMRQSKEACLQVEPLVL